ncbi:MAG: response regulator transcription factor [Salinivirgaceae bacterium]|nr:response regulator transcription factor [Salinivirgaceae bacterium]
MYKAVIVDDELDAIEGIKLIIQENCTNIKIAGTAQSVDEAIKTISAEKPDVVFLDIEMPGGSGFDVLEGLPERNFHVIFVTAYNQYAIKAFKYSAIDYLLKPVDIDELIGAINKVGNYDNSNNQFETKIETLLENIKNNKPEKIALSTSESIEFVKICDIIQIQAEGSYSTLRFLDQSELVVSKNLGEFESLLQDHPFYRTHQSHLISLQHVKKINRLGNEIVMDDGSVAYLSRRKKNQFLELMSTLVQQKK